MVHQYKNNGYNIVLDVCSGSVHVVDDLVYDIISLYEENDKEQIIKALSQYDSADVSEAYDEVAQLVEDGTLFTDDVYKDYIIDFKKRKTVVKALCLHIAHDCNLPADTALPVRENIRETGRLCHLRWQRNPWIFWLRIPV